MEKRWSLRLLVERATHSELLLGYLELFESLDMSRLILQLYDQNCRCLLRRYCTLLEQRDHHFEVDLKFNILGALQIRYIQEAHASGILMGIYVKGKRHPESWGHLGE